MYVLGGFCLESQRILNICEKQNRPHLYVPEFNPLAVTIFLLSACTFYFSVFFFHFYYFFFVQYLC